MKTDRQHRLWRLFAILCIYFCEKILQMKKSLWLICFVFLIVISVKAQNDTVFFSAHGGFYEDVLSIELYNYYPQNHIRFTTNGNRPTAQSPLYEEALVLDECLYSKSDIYTIVNCPEESFFLPDSVRHCIVIRAAVFDENDSCVSQVMTQSYFIRSLGCDTHGLPAVSLCADSLDLFDYHRGIFVPGAWCSSNLPLWTGNYFRRGIEWERRCNVEFYDNENCGINQEAGLRTHGGASRRFQQKGMKLFARKEYGKKRFKHKFFSDTPVNSIKHFSLKPFRCSNWMQIGVNDPLTHRVARQLDIDVLGTRAVVVFLNGEYWGIYYMEEATDGHYLEDHYGVDPDSCNIIENWTTLDSGDDAEWQELYDWVESADLSQPENYDFLCSKIDMHNFIDYLVFELYSANVDWPANNIRCWQAGDRKWRWIFFDGDGCFFRNWDVFANIVDTCDNLGPSNTTSTLFYRRLLRNTDFVEDLGSRFVDLMTDMLNYDHTGPIFAELCEEIEDEIPYQSQRFHFPTKDSVCSAHISLVDAYLQSRNQIMEEQIMSFTSLLFNEVSTNYSYYPNPFSDQLCLLVSSDAPKEEKLMIFDMMGRCVFVEKECLMSGMNSIIIQPDLPPGIYVLQLGEHGHRIVKY